MPLTLRAVLVTALLSGVLGGLVFFTAQLATTRHLIVLAEIHEHAAQHAAQHAAGAAHDHAAGGQEWEPAEGLERTAYTLGADLLLGIGFAFLLVGAISLSGRTVTPLAGLAWGVAGFLAFAAAPALGLPPEPPGVEAADLLLRQGWWLGTACATATGLWLMVMAQRPWQRLAGAALLLAPHLIGAPQAPFGRTEEAAALARSFTWASMAATAALWATLGLAAGWLLGRPAGSAGSVPSHQG